MWNDGTDKDYIAHHGIKGQKWGERRFQYEDGTLTPVGKERYGYGIESATSTHNNFHSRTKKVYNSQKGVTVKLGEKYSNTPVAGRHFFESNNVSFNEANRKKMISNIGSMINKIYVNDSPYAKYYSKEEFANDLKKGLSNYPTVDGVYMEDVVQDVIAEVLKKADKKIRVREKADAVKDKRDPVRTYFMLKKGPGRM